MSEAEILALRGGMTGLIVSVVSVSFGMISAYVVGLWLFLRKVPGLLRIAAFGIFSLGLAFMGGIAWGLDGMLRGLDRAWERLEVKTSGIPDFGGTNLDYMLGFSLYEIFALLGFISYAAIYSALAYMTFCYKWPENDIEDDAL